MTYKEKIALLNLIVNIVEKKDFIYSEEKNENGQPDLWINPKIIDLYKFFKEFLEKTDEEEINV